MSSLSNRKRSASVGHPPQAKVLARSPAESPAAAQLEVRCACQYFMSDSLLPERVNPVGSKPPVEHDAECHFSRQPRPIESFQQSKSLDQSTRLSQSNLLLKKYRTPSEDRQVEEAAKISPAVSEKLLQGIGLAATLPRDSRSQYGSQRSIERASQSNLLLRKYRRPSEDNPHLEHYTLPRAGSRPRSMYGSRRSIDRFSSRNKLEKGASEDSQNIDDFPEAEDLPEEPPVQPLSFDSAKRGPVARYSGNEETFRAPVEALRAAEEPKLPAISIQLEEDQPQAEKLDLFPEMAPRFPRLDTAAPKVPVEPIVVIPPTPEPPLQEAPPSFPQKAPPLQAPPPVLQEVTPPAPPKPKEEPKPLTLSLSGDSGGRRIIKNFSMSAEKPAEEPPKPAEEPKIELPKAETKQNGDAYNMAIALRDTIFSAELLTTGARRKPSEPEFQLTCNDDRMEQYSSLPRMTKRDLSKGRSFDRPTPSKDPSVVRQHSDDPPRSQTLRRGSVGPVVRQYSDEAQKTQTLPRSKLEETRSRPMERNVSQRSQSSSLIKKKYSFRSQSQGEPDPIPGDELVSENGELKKTPSVTIVKSKIDNERLKKSKLLQRYSDPADPKVSQTLPRAWRTGDHEYEPVEPPPESPDVQMSAQEFQARLDDRYFNPKPAAPSAFTPIKKEKTPVVADEEPKEPKKSFLKNAQETSKTWQRKFTNQISNQAGNIKTKIGNLKRSKSGGEELEPEPEPAPVKGSVKVSETSTVTFEVSRAAAPEEASAEVVEGEKSKFSKFKASLPPIKKPNFSKLRSFDKPSLPDMPRVNISETISKIKLKRSKSVKEEIEVREEVRETENLPEEKKKKFDFDTFRTYPRMLKNKLKKQKPASDQADSESGKFTEFNQDVDVVEIKPVARKKPPRPVLPQPDSYESKSFESRDDSKDLSFRDQDLDFNQNEVESLSSSAKGFSFARQDTQSLQSGSNRHGVLEQIDDDQFFLRKKGISEDNIQIGDYISTAIREGLMDPVNALAQMVSDNYELDEEELRYLQEFQKEHPELNLELEESFVPRKPQRSKKQSEEDIAVDQVVPGFDESKWNTLKDIDDGSASVDMRDFNTRFVPPTPPKRRKKRSATGKPNGIEALPQQKKEDNQRINVPLARAEDEFMAPIPPSRRSHSRSRSMLTEDDRTSRGAESMGILGDSADFNSVEGFKQVPDYAVIKKDPPPRPPAPVRRRSTKSLPDEVPTPVRPHRNYSTIVPSRPPRKRSESREAGKGNESDYEPIGDASQESDSAKKLQSNDVVSKMKDRPLPPPPRPPRDRKSREKTPKTEDEVPKDDDDEPKDDFDGGAVKTTLSAPKMLQAESSFESNGAPRSLQAVSSFESDYSYQVEETDAFVQTDPLPDDFQLEELEITEDMRTITPTKFRDGFESFLFSSSRVESRPETPSIEQELQRIQNRPASQPSSRPHSRPSSRVSVRSRNSSRPTTPALVYVERKISTPLFDGEQLEASLTVQPVEIDDETGDVIIVSAESPLDRIRDLQEALDQRFREDREAEKQHEEPIIIAEPLVERQQVQERQQEPPVATLEPPVEPQRQELEPQIQESEPQKQEYVPQTQESVPEIQAQTEEPPPAREPAPPARRSRDFQEIPPRPPKPSPPKEIPAETQPEAPPVAPPRSQSLTNQESLRVTNLEVDRLSVNSLEASRINVSELEGGAIRAQDIDSPAVRNIQIPPSLIEEIVEQVARRTRAAQPAPRSDAQVTPRQIVEEFSIPPASFYRLTNPPQAPPSQQLTDEPSIAQLTGQLASACGSALSRQGRNLMNFLRSASKDANRRDLHFVLFILIVIIAGLFMLGMDHSSDTKHVHHYHWDYFNPPGNSGRPN